MLEGTPKFVDEGPAPYIDGSYAYIVADSSGFRAGSTDGIFVSTPSKSPVEALEDLSEAKRVQDADALASPGEVDEGQELEATMLDSPDIELEE
jgi:hypothetical protein